MNEKENLSKNEKRWLVVGLVVMGFLYALTGPIVNFYFMRLVSERVLAVALVAGLALSVMTKTGGVSPACKIAIP